MPTISVNGVQLYYEIHGPVNADLLVLSNGILMSTASWANQVSLLSRFFRVLVYDCRGMWQSEHPSGPYSMEIHADDLAGLLDELGYERAHIAGISYGSEISMMFALKYPERTLSLFVADGVSEIDPLLQAQCETWVTAAQRKDAHLLLQVTTPFNFSNQWIIKNPKILTALEEKYKQLDFEAFLHLMDSFFGLIITHRLKEIRCPTMVLVGELDILKSRAYAEKIAGAIKDSEYLVIPNAAHAVCFEQPAAFNSALLGFITKNQGEK
jgi:3-oxoadipate enol-lactonase